MRREVMTHRTISIREILERVLAPVCERYYYEVVAQNTRYPYVIYNLDDSDDFESVENFTLEIDGWDNPQDGSTTRLEILMGDIDNVLNRLLVTKEGRSFRFYRQNRRGIRDPEKRLKRRQLIYQIKVMGVN